MCEMQRNVQIFSGYPRSEPYQDNLAYHKITCHAIKWKQITISSPNANDLLFHGNTNFYIQKIKA